MYMFTEADPMQSLISRLRLVGPLGRESGSENASSLPVVGGSHDPLLEWALRESGCGLAHRPEGSGAGLQRFADGEIVAAAIHLHAFDRDSDENVAIMRSEPWLRDAVLIGFVRREQGILVALGNPLGIRGVTDMDGAGARVAIRPSGAGAQLLLESLLMRENLDISKLDVVSPACLTGTDIGVAVRSGRADCGIATRSVANALGLSFVSLVWERFDLVVRQRDYFRPPLQTLFSFLQTTTFRRYAEEAGGYDLSEMGGIRFAP